MVSPRPLRAVLGEAVGAFALAATRRHYDEQPGLWRLGEQGRARTLEDYGHHFLALGHLDETSWRRHLEYCEALFAQRGFPHEWLTDAWRIMGDTLRAELDHEPDARDAALALLAEATRRPLPPADAREGARTV